ncbi:AlpA family phage regulatory protein [Pseudomonas sp. 51_B]|uniref:AlpA family phage regulatory protein n=1 Tax=Pseudomonas sp. 51_B TaxID=2813573 RepID=UPI001FAFB51A|nr:AlpA family phage regulatory protein [Pseudomonas sp. 51_B]
MFTLPFPRPSNTSWASEIINPRSVIIRMRDVEAITGLGRNSIYKRLKSDSSFPRPVKLSDSTSRGAPVGWVLAEVQDWVEGRAALREKQ